MSEWVVFALLQCALNFSLIFTLYGTRRRLWRVESTLDTVTEAVEKHRHHGGGSEHTGFSFGPKLERHGL